MLTRWPLAPPGGLRRPWCWVAAGVGVWTFEMVTPPDLHVVPLGALPVALAAWSGALGWSVALACVLPWASWLSWWWGGSDMALWVELANDVGYLVSLLGVALAMTALQRQAVRLALERDPRLRSPDEGEPRDREP
jgi:hypothetical protein